MSHEIVRTATARSVWPDQMIRSCSGYCAAATKHLSPVTLGIRMSADHYFESVGTIAWAHEAAAQNVMFQILRSFHKDAASASTTCASSSTNRTRGFDALTRLPPAPTPFRDRILL